MIKIIYASRSGNVQSLINHLELEATKLESGNERVAEEFVLFTYNDGAGELPSIVKDFLNNNKNYLVGAVVSGNPAFKNTFNHAASILEEQYQTKIIARVVNSGSEDDYAIIKDALSKL